MKLLYFVCSFFWCLAVVTCSIEDRFKQVEIQLDDLREAINFEKCETQCKRPNEPKNSQSQLIDLSKVQPETILDQSTWIHLGYGYSRLTTLKRTSEMYYVIVGNSEGVCIYNSLTNTLVKRFDDSFVYDIKLLGSNLLLQASNSTKIKIWNIDTGLLVNTLLAHSDKILCIGLNKEQSLMLTGGDDKKVILWEIGNEFKQIRTHTGHTDWIRSLFSLSPRTDF